MDEILINVLPRLPLWAIATMMILRWFVMPLLNWLRQQSKTTEVAVRASSESDIRSDAIVRTLADTLAKNTLMLGDNLAAIRALLERQSDDITIIKDITTSHRREFTAIQIAQRMDKIEKLLRILQSNPARQRIFFAKMVHWQDRRFRALQTKVNQMAQ